MELETKELPDGCTCFDDWCKSVKDCGHEVQPNSPTARQRRLGWDAATSFMREANNSLEEENRVLREALNPHEGVKGLYPLILYFDDRAEADGFTALVQQAKPGMKSYKI